MSDEEEEYEEEEDDQSQNKVDNNVNNKVEENKNVNVEPVIEQKTEEKKETQSKKTKTSKKSSTKSKKATKIDENAYILPSPEQVTSTRQFLEGTVTKAIQEALLDLARNRDKISDPLLYVGEYLVKKAKGEK
jgi:chromosomal replication initiation ATPase DnaA